MKKFIWALFLFVIPFVITTLVPHMHSMDIATYNHWDDQFSNQPNAIVKDFYIHTDCNYSALSALGSIGVMHFIKTTLYKFAYGKPVDDLWKMAKIFRFSMTFFDALNALLVFSFLSYLGVSFAPYLALFFALTPSTWAASGVWGQIDGFCQFFIFLSVFVNIVWLKKLLKNSSSPNTGLAFLSFFLLIPVIFNKQLMVFSLPYLIGFSLINLFFEIKKVKNILAMFSPLLSLFIFIGVDRFFNLKYDFKSLNAYIWLGGGSNHGDDLSLNGFNIWILMMKPLKYPSTEPFIGSFSPKQIGLFLFGVFSAYIFARFILLFKRASNSSQFLILIGQILLIHSLSQLGFNLLLTGSHERYLYHFFPSLLLSFALFVSVDRRYLKWLFIVLIGSIGYGLFVWSTLLNTDDIETRAKHFVMLGFFAPLLVSLIYFEKKNSVLHHKVGVEVLP